MKFIMIRKTIKWMVLIGIMIMLPQTNHLSRDALSKEMSFSILKEQPIGYLSIPKLELNEPFYELESKENTVSKHVQYIVSDTPDIPNGNFILAAHSGTADISYFKNLNQLMIGDIFFITYQNKTYSYEVIDYYETLKNEMKWRRPMDQTTATLVTCVSSTNRRLIVLGSQI